MEAKILPHVIAQSPDWIIVNKPAFWLTVPPTVLDGKRPILLDWVAAQCQAKVWICHRLDFETSGLVLFALNPQFHKKANQWFEHHQIKKEYLFLAQGEHFQPSRVIQAEIEGKASKTQLIVKQQFGSQFFLGLAKPLSGRRHQIRIHLAGIGHPILGDIKYGGQSSYDLGALEVNRVALHAARLQFPTGESFEAPLPQDFNLWVLNLEGRET